jgi:hypothetical protein
MSLQQQSSSSTELVVVNDDAETADAAVASLVASELSYAVEFTSFQGSFEGIIKRAKEITEEKPAPRAAPRKKPTWAVAAAANKDEVADAADDATPPSSPTPAWVSCFDRLYSAYTKVGYKCQPFMSMFQRFFDEHADALASPIFDEETNAVRDDFFKKLDLFPRPTGGASPATSSVKATVAELKGPVVFYNNDQKCAHVCFPIGELYRYCVAEYFKSMQTNDEAAKNKLLLLPTLTLLDFYSILFHSVPSSHEKYEAIRRNLECLCEAAETVSPGSGPGATESEDDDDEHHHSADPTANMIAGLMSMLGMGGGRGEGAGLKKEEMATAISSVGEAMKKLIDSVAPAMSVGGGAEGSSSDAARQQQPLDLQSMFESFGATLKSPDVQKHIADAASFLTKSYGSGGGETTSALGLD